MTTGEKIKQLRKELGMTQEELGNLIGVQKAAINKYETGVVVNLKQATIAALAEALHVSPVELLSPELTDEEKMWSAYVQGRLDSSDHPVQAHTPESIRIVSGVDKMPPEIRARAEQMLALAFAEYFKEDPDHDA